MKMGPPDVHFKILWDGTMSTIVYTKDPIDEFKYVYGTLHQAREELLGNLRATRNDYNSQIKYVQSLRLATIEYEPKVGDNYV